MTPPTHQKRPLSPYTALDLTEGGFNWCGKVLADLGADVIKVEPPDGSPTRNIGPFVDGIEGPDRSLFWASYCVNKRSVTLDLRSEVSVATLRSLAASADILIESFRPGHMAGLGLGYDDLKADNAALVYTSITPFGQSGPYSEYVAPDLVAWSMGGMQYLGGNEDRQPVRISAPQSELHAGAHAAAGTMAAFWQSRKTGRGQHVDVSMQTAVIWTLMNATPFPPLHGTNMERSGDYRSRGHIVVRHVFSCRDGHLSVLQAPRTLRGLAEWMVEEGVAPDWLAEIDWDEWNPAAIAEDDLDGIELFNRVQTRMEEFVASKTKNDLYLRAIDHGMLIAPCHTVKDIAESVQLEARDFWHDLEYPDINRSLTQLGPFIRMSESPIEISLPAPRIGEHNREILPRTKQATAQRRRPGQTSSSASIGMPFDGIRILDFTWVGVGPITIKHLADFGADVIRVEAASRPDVLRSAAPFKDGQPGGLNRSQFSGNYNSSKRGLGLNLALPEGREFVRRLIKEWQPDVIAESFTPRVMRDWKLDYPNIRELVPDVIYFSTCQQGQTGPHSKYAGFGQLAGALAGFYHITGWPDREPAGPYGAYSDFVNPPNAAAAIVAALEYRRRTGKGQYLDLSQYECAAHFLAPAIMDYITNGKVLNRRGNDDDSFFPNDVYRCKDKERGYTGVGPSWIAISVTNQDQWTRLCEIMGRTDMAADERFENAESRRRHSSEIDAAIGAWTKDQDAHGLMAALQDSGVPAGVAQSQADLWEDPQLQHRGFFQWLDHAECGPMPYDGLTYHLSETPGALRMPQALIGQHNEEILKEILGFDDDEISELVVGGVLESS